MIEPTPERAQPMNDHCGHCGRVLDGRIQLCSNGGWCSVEGQPPLSESGATEGNQVAEFVERIRFEKWYAANRMQLYMHLDQRLRLAIEDTARESWMQGKAASLKPEPTGAQGRADKADPRLEDLVMLIRRMVVRLRARDDAEHDPKSHALADAAMDYLRRKDLASGADILRAVSLNPSEPVSPQPQAEDAPEYHTECRYPDAQCERIPDSKADGGFRLKCTAPPLPPKAESPLPVQEPQEDLGHGIGISWSRPSDNTRRDIVGIRELSDGRKEYLMHNEALCHPYYLAVSALPPFIVAAPELPVRPQEEEDSNVIIPGNYYRALLRDQAAYRALLKLSNPAPTSEAGEES